MWLVYLYKYKLSVFACILHARSRESLTCVKWILQEVILLDITKSRFIRFAQQNSAWNMWVVMKLLETEVTKRVDKWKQSRRVQQTEKRRMWAKTQTTTRAKCLLRFRIAQNEKWHLLLSRTI